MARKQSRKNKSRWSSQSCLSKARATVAKKVAHAGEVEWEGKMAEATDNSWKDEFALVVLLTPAILVFIPGMRDHVHKGFEVLSTLPLLGLGGMRSYEKFIAREKYQWIRLDIYEYTLKKKKEVLVKKRKENNEIYKDQYGKKKGHSILFRQKQGVIKGVDKKEKNKGS